MLCEASTCGNSDFRCAIKCVVCFTPDEDLCFPGLLTILHCTIVWNNCHKEKCEVVGNQGSV